MKNIDYKKLFLYIIITILIGTIPSIFVFKNMDIYGFLNKPPLSPPGFVFPVVWTILYILMGISFYKIIKDDSNKYKEEARLIYFLQLIVNALWTPIFFGFREYFFAFTWLLMLLVLVIIMIIIFYRINKSASFLQIPYLIWLFVALYLNFGIFILNP